jgi:hypothetical protein
MLLDWRDTEKLDDVHYAIDSRRHRHIAYKVRAERLIKEGKMQHGFHQRHPHRDLLIRQTSPHPPGNKTSQPFNRAGYFYRRQPHLPAKWIIVAIGDSNQCGLINAQQCTNSTSSARLDGICYFDICRYNNVDENGTTIKYRILDIKYKSLACDVS